MRASAWWPLAAALALAGCGEAAVEAPVANGQAAAAREVGAVNQAATADFPALTGRVVDTAEMLSVAEEERLTATLAGLEQRTSDQLVVVTVPSLGERTIEAFALALGNHWQIGQRGKDNGVLLVVARDQRTVRIEVGYGLERILTDARAAEIIADTMVPKFREADYAGAIVAGADAIVATLVAQADTPRRGRP